MTSKQELREQIALMRGDVEAWRRAVDRTEQHRDAAIWERDEAVRGRDGWRRTTDVVVRQRDEAIAERDEARARIAELEASILEHATTEPETTPEPRPFRVGDRVRVAEGATYRAGMSGTLASKSAGREGVVSEVWDDGDLIIDTEVEGFCAASPEFCTLIEPAPDDDTEQATADLAEPRTLTITVPAGVAIEWSLR